MIYDINTKNLSFLKMSYQLKQQGVKNNKFMLLLNNDNLAGVDPYSQNLTPTEKASIYQEICTNYWYFLREVAKVPQEGNPDGILFQLNLGNMAAAYACINNINHLLILPRQQGKTVVEVMFSVWVFFFSGTYINETYLHKSQSGSVDNLSRFKKFKELLPHWLQELISSGKDKDNLEEKFSDSRKNRIQALSSAANDAAADKLGRGSSTAMVYMDEFAFLERNKIVMNALVPAWTTSATVAKNNGAPYGIRITTTPNSLSLPQAQYCYQILVDACPFTYNIYDIPLDQIHEYVKKNSGNDYLFIQYTWKELGLNKEWYEGQLRMMSGDALNAKRELDCVWPESSEGNIFSEEQLDKIKYYVKPEIFSLNIDGYAINFFEKPDFTLNYIISCDVSGGLSLDRSVISIIHPYDFHIAGLFMNSRIDTEDFKHLIYKLATEYLFHAIINIECNSYGLNILDTFIKMPNIEPRLYRETAERVGEKVISDGRVVKQKSKKIIYGTSTNSKSRALMMEMLPSIVDDEPEIFVANAFYEEIKNLVRTKRNKIEARQGFHDDIVMSYLITRYSLAYGKCFQQMFHIYPTPTKANMRNAANSSDTLMASFSNMVDYANAYDTSDSISIDYSKYYKDYVPEEKRNENKLNSFFDTISKLNNDDF